MPATKEQLMVYEELRLLRKHTAWSLMHLNRLCELLKPDDTPDKDFVDPNQLEMFLNDKPDIQ